MVGARALSSHGSAGSWKGPGMGNPFDDDRRRQRWWEHVAGARFRCRRIPTRLSADISTTNSSLPTDCPCRPQHDCRCAGCAPAPGILDIETGVHMKMKTLYAALSGAFLLGAATLAPAQTSTAPAGNTAAHPVKNTEAAMSSDY